MRSGCLLVGLLALTPACEDEANRVKRVTEITRALKEVEKELVPGVRAVDPDRFTHVYDPRVGLCFTIYSPCPADCRAYHILQVDCEKFKKRPLPLEKEEPATKPVRR